LSTVCSEKEIARISNLKSPSNVIAICKIPTYKINRKDKKPLIFLDNVNDPGNFGTIVRTLDWFGYKQLFCSKNTVDCFNSKSVMASMGSIFRVNCHYIDFEEFQQLFPQHVTFGSSLTGENIGSVKLVPNSIIVIGNESNGVSKNIKEKLKNTIRIPGNGKAESLNVSVATGIILNELEKLTLKSK
jgi:TrmH family RNA methyltransferase